MAEAALYPAVKRFLGDRGFAAKGEVGGCDIVAVRPGEPPFLVIVELKLALTLELVLQAVDRLSAGDEVWLAIPARRKGRGRDGRVPKLCRLLGLGLLLVHGTGAVEVLVEPGPYQPRRNAARRRRLLAEHGKRRGDPSPGGTRGVPILTAYRQDALRCAARLQNGPLPTRVLREETARATAILYRNVYGWFERRERGIYALTEAGTAALERWGAG